MFVAHPPTVKLIPKSDYGKNAVIKYGHEFLLISKMPNRALVATKCGKWQTFVEKNDVDFDMEGTFHC